MNINIEKTMTKAKLSQYRLAKELGVSPTQVFRWYHQKNKPNRFLERELLDYFKSNNIEIYYDG